VKDAGVEPPPIRYAKTVDGVYIAYQVNGDGPIDLVYIMGFTGNFEVEFDSPWGRRFLDRLSSFSRVILFDKRGTGISDRVVGTPDLDARADDLRAVLDAVGSDRAVLFGDSEGGALAAFFAATHPDRVFALVLAGSAARVAWAPDYPFGTRNEDREAFRKGIVESWGSVESAKAFLADEAPSHANDPEWIDWVGRAERQSASPSAALAFEEVWFATDVRGVLPSVLAPTLVLSRAPDDHEPSRDLAQRIPGARHVQVPGKDHVPYAGDIEPLLSEVERFVQSVSAEEASFDRVLATVLFTDVIGSTVKATELGDAAWKDVLERHHAVVRAMIARYRGVEVDTAGDGFFATFDGPARGVRCALAISEAVQALGIEIRAGLHTGEVETIDGKIGGIAVHIGARVGALAGASEVLVSATVKDLVTGSGLNFEDAGEHELKGLPDRWHLYRVLP
jgi:pimeloyl-ACP methyl ester carboxylesterase